MNTNRRFWVPETGADLISIKRLLGARFRSLPLTISEVLDRHDPLEMVYPGNPDEYFDVVAEFLVRIQRFPTIGRPEIERALAESFVACLDECPTTTQLEEMALALAALDLAALSIGHSVSPVDPED